MAEEKARVPFAHGSSNLRIAYIEDLLASENIITPHTCAHMSAINYSQVEVAPKVRVAMEKEILSRRAVRQMIASKPGVVKALVDKK